MLESHEIPRCKCYFSADGVKPGNPSFRKKMDARVKPAHDVEREVQFDWNSP
jgi:hypothetical protein